MLLLQSNSHWSGWAQPRLSDLQDRGRHVKQPVAPLASSSPPPGAMQRVVSPIARVPPNPPLGVPAPPSSRRAPGSGAARLDQYRLNQLYRLPPAAPQALVQPETETRRGGWRAKEVLWDAGEREGGGQAVWT